MPRSPFGCPCGPPNIAIGPIGLRRGCAVPGTPCIITGSGSSKIATGCPAFTAATKLAICSGPSDDGCTARRTSKVSVIGAVASTWTTSYCFSSSSTSGCRGRCWPPIMSKPPYRSASVVSTPSRFRFCWAAVQIERTSSYSTGVPRSKNGTTTFSRPLVKAQPRKIS